MLPNILLIGAMKSGTTALVADLEEFFSVFVPKEKEPDYLHKFTDVEKCKNKYRRLYAQASGKKYRADASTMYSMDPWIENIAPFAKKVLGSDLKIIYIVREPVSRIVSHVNHDLRSGRLKVKDEKIHIKKDSPYHQISQYDRQLRFWMCEFPESSIHLMLFEDYVKDKKKSIEDLACFLGVQINERVPSALSIKNSAESVKLIENKLMLKFISSSFYKEYVKIYFPHALIDYFKRKFEKKPNVRKVTRDDLLIENLNILNDIYEKMKNKCRNVERDVVNE